MPSLTVRILGVEIIHLDLTTDVPDDEARDLSGGELGGRGLDDGPVDLALGFTGGWERE